MSARIGQIIEVVEAVRGNRYDALPQHSISHLRLDAVSAVAERRGITPNSVADKFIRQLSPEVQSTSQFDQLLKRWLVEGSTELRDIVLRHAIDEQDRQLIASTFFLADPQETLLADEFGLDPSDPTFQEGSERLRIHLSKERNRQLVSLAKELWLRQGELRCAICTFSFGRAYGEAGEGFIEAHHVTPLSELTARTVVRPTDLAPVCSNCHGIIHRHRPWLTIDEMREIFARQALLA